MTDVSTSPYDQGHIIVSAVRLFSHREGKMPTAKDISTLTGFPMDLTLHLCNKLLEISVLGIVEGAFDDRYHVLNHLELEELPRSVDSEQMSREVEKFKADRMEKQKKIEEMFTGKDKGLRKKERMKDLEEKLKDPTTHKKPNPLDVLTRSRDEEEDES